MSRVLASFGISIVVVLAVAIVAGSLWPHAPVIVGLVVGAVTQQAAFYVAMHLLDGWAYV